MKRDLLFLNTTLSSNLTVLHGPLGPIIPCAQCPGPHTLRLQRLHLQLATPHHYEINLRLLHHGFLHPLAPYLIQVLQVRELRYPQLSRALLLLLLLLGRVSGSRGEERFGALGCFF